MKRTEEEEVSTPQIAAINVDDECALIAQLEKQDQLMGADKVVDSFVNEPNVEHECERMYAWRN